MEFKFVNLPEELVFGANEILKELSSKADGTTVYAEKCDKGFKVEKTDDGVKIFYDRKTDFYRALSFVAKVNETGETVCQSAGWSLLCYMVDISRNAVVSVEGGKRLIRTLALMGYDSLMLYSEDTYEIPEYPYFGHMRGRLTKAELKELDAYGVSLGVELIPCMQTLAHLTSALRWKCYENMKDTPDILLAGCEDTYKLIDAMLKNLSECFSTKRIHLGMDEAHNLGLGKYLDKNGYQNRFSILSTHLAKVKEICDKYGLEPMIWSDMYFRLYNHGKYYMAEGEIPQNIIDEVPNGVGLVYWDYYSTDVKTIDCMFENHKRFGNKVIFAGGAWKWSGIVPYNRVSNYCANIHIDACYRNGCDEVIVTGWGDNGGEASQFSILPTLSLYAERCFDKDITDADYNARFEDCFETSIADFMKLDLPNEVYGDTVNDHSNPAKYLFYNGVLNGIMDCHVPENADEIYKKHAQTLEKCTDNKRFGYIFETLSSLCDVLSLKAEMSKNIYKAYNEDDKATLRKYADEIIPETIGKITSYLEVYRKQWYCENKTFGFDIQEMRFGALKESLRGASLRIKAYLNGEISVIEELIQPSLPYNCIENKSARISVNNWEHNVTASKHNS